MKGNKTAYLLSVVIYIFTHDLKSWHETRSMGLLLYLCQQTNMSVLSCFFWVFFVFFLLIYFVSFLVKNVYSWMEEPEIWLLQIFKTPWPQTNGAQWIMVPSSQNPTWPTINTQTSHTHLQRHLYTFPKIIYYRKNNPYIYTIKTSVATTFLLI